MNDTENDDNLYKDETVGREEEIEEERERRKNRLKNIFFMRL